jgi:hypothetical protein
LNFIKQYLLIVFFLLSIGMFAMIPMGLVFWLIAVVFGFSEDWWANDPRFGIAIWALGTACVGAGFAIREENTSKGLREQNEYVAELRCQQEGNIKRLERNNEANKRRSAKLREELKSQTLAWNKTLHRENQIALRQKLALCLDISNLSAEVEDERQQKRLLEDEIRERDAREGDNNG